MSEQYRVPPTCIRGGISALRFEHPEKNNPEKNTSKDTFIFEYPSRTQLNIPSAAAFTRGSLTSNSEDIYHKTANSTHQSSTNDVVLSTDSSSSVKHSIGNMLKLFSRKPQESPPAQAAETSYQLPLGWTSYLDDAKKQLFYLDHSTGKTHDKPPRPRFTFDPNVRPPNREFDTWSENSSSTIDSQETPLTFTKTTTVTAMSSPASESPTGTPTLDARLRNREAYNFGGAGGGTRSVHPPEELYNISHSRIINLPSSPDPVCCCPNHIFDAAPCIRKSCCERTIDQPLVPCGYIGGEDEVKLRKGINGKSKASWRKFVAERQCPSCGKWLLSCEHDRLGDVRSSVKIPKLRYRRRFSSMDVGEGTGPSSP